jgi:hypothetical protein
MKIVMQKYSLFLLFWLLPLVGMQLFAQDNSANAEEAPEELTTFEKYFGMGCYDENLTPQVVKAFKSQAAELEPRLIKLIENGPSDRVVEHEKKEYADAYMRRQLFLNPGERKITIEREGEEPREIVAEDQDPDAFEDAALAAATRRLKYRALEGLRLLETESSLKYLREKSRDRQFELYREAAELLEK